MSHMAERPWWADVQHLRPSEDGGDQKRAPRGRFDRPSAPSRRPANEHGASRAATRRDPHAAERPAARRAESREARSAERPAPPRRERPEPENWLEPAEPAKPAQRRTIEIRGQVDRVHGVAPVPSPGPQRHRGRMAHERVGPRPDRVAMWAVILGLLLILVALISSPGADAAAIFISP